MHVTLIGFFPWIFFIYRKHVKFATHINLLTHYTKGTFFVNKLLLLELFTFLFQNFVTTTSTISTFPHGTISLSII